MERYSICLLLLTLLLHVSCTAKIKSTSSPPVIHGTTIKKSPPAATQNPPVKYGPDILERETVTVSKQNNKDYKPKAWKKLTDQKYTTCIGGDTKTSLFIKLDNRTFDRLVITVVGEVTVSPKTSDGSTIPDCHQETSQQGKYRHHTLLCQAGKIQLSGSSPWKLCSVEANVALREECLYGVGCKNNCSTGCRDSCHQKTGHCDCKPGWKGNRCDEECTDGQYGVDCLGNCSPGCNDTCDSKTGNCSCKAGWEYDNCDTVCRGGQYGMGCVHRCSPGCDDTCDSKTGTCSCKAGWKGDDCNSECVGGWYGVGCEKTCSPGCSGDCDKSTGGCPCNPGWEGANCVDECGDGLYGFNCVSTCEPGCDDICDKDTGRCNCSAGWTGSTCDKPTTPTTPAPTAPPSGLTERNDLDCSGGMMKIHLPLSLFPTHSVTLRDPTCRLRLNGTHLTADVAFNRCGTTCSFTNNSLVFSNELLATSNSSQQPMSIIDYGLASDDVQVPLSCEFPRESQLEFGYIPLQRKAHFYEKQYGQLEFEIKHYETEQFQTIVPNTGLPVGVPLNSEVFIDVALEQTNNKRLGISVDSCIATPTLSPADPLWYPVIKDGCPSQADVRTFTTPDVNDFRFSFLAFKFTNAPLVTPSPSGSPTQMVYLHCQVSACQSSNCSTSCSTPSRIVKRSAEEQRSHLVSTGPFLLVSEDGNAPGYSSAVVVATLSVAAVAVLVAMVAIVAWRQSALQLSKYRKPIEIES